MDTPNPLPAANTVWIEEMTWMEVPGDQLKEPEVTLSDFLKSLRTTRPSVGEDDIVQHVEFTQQYGQEG